MAGFKAKHMIKADEATQPLARELDAPEMWSDGDTQLEEGLPESLTDYMLPAGYANITPPEVLQHRRTLEGAA